MKTEYEKNYEENRESEARWLFIVLERYHKDAMRIFNNFESEFNELGKIRKELVTKMKFVPLDQLENEQVVSFKDIITDQKKMDYLKDTMNYELEQMKKVIIDYEKDRNLNNLRNYFSFDRFVLKIFSMMKNINDYAEGLFQADLRPNSLMWAIKNADEIIQYLKEKDLHKKDENVKVFVERWEKAVNDYLK